MPRAIFEGEMLTDNFLCTVGRWLSTESKSECEKCVPSLKGPLQSRVNQNYHMTENVFFRQYDRILGKI